MKKLKTKFMKVSIVFALVLSSFFMYGQSGHYGKKNIIHFSPSINFKWAEILGVSEYDLDEPQFVTFPLHISYERVIANSYSLALNFMNHRGNASSIGSSRIYSVNNQGIYAREIKSVDELNVSNTAIYLDVRKYTEGLAPLSSYISFGAGIVNSRLIGDPRFELISGIENTQGEVLLTLPLSEIIETYPIVDLSNRNLLLLNFGGGIQYPLNRYITFGTHFNMSFDSSLFSRIFESYSGFESALSERTRMPAYRSFLMRIGFDIAVVF